LSGKSVAVTSVAVRFGGGNVAVSAGSGAAEGVSVGFARTDVGEGSGEGTGEGGAAVVAGTAVGVASPGIGNGRHAPSANTITNAGILFFMASPLSTRID
jgi:hypothetical protein